MSEPTKTPQELPASITLGGVEYSLKDTPELANLVKTISVDAAAKEKSKLYSKLDELKQIGDQLKNVRLEEPAGVNVDELRSSIVKEVTEAFGTQLAPILGKFQKTEQMEIADYRNKLITDHQLDCIPELVVGNTKEELDAALKTSQEIRSRYPKTELLQVDLSKDQPTSVTPPKPDIVANAPVPVTPAVPATPVAVVPAPGTIPVTPNNVTDFKNISNKEFAEKREQFLSQVSTLVG